MSKETRMDLFRLYAVRPVVPEKGISVAWLPQA